MYSYLNNLLLNWDWTMHVLLRNLYVSPKLSVIGKKLFTIFPYYSFDIFRICSYDLSSSWYWQCVSLSSPSIMLVDQFYWFSQTTCFRFHWFFSFVFLLCILFIVLLNFTISSPLFILYLNCSFFSSFWK